jgi:hypothetical protein
MAKADRLGGGLGRKPVTPALPAGPPLLRESEHQARATALDKVVDALKPFNKVERPVAAIPQCGRCDSGGC